MSTIVLVVFSWSRPDPKSISARLLVGGLLLLTLLSVVQLATAPQGAIAVTNAAASSLASRVYGQPDFISNSSYYSNRLSYAYRAALDSQDNLYVTDSSHNQIVFYPSGTVTPTKTYQYGFNVPRGVARDPNGLYVADSFNNRLFYFADSLLGSSNLMTYTRLYGQADRSSVFPNKNKLGADSFDDPVGLATDSAGGLYAVDNDNHRVLYFPNGSQLASRVYGQPDFTTDLTNNGGVSATSLNKPSAVAVDSTNGVYITDGDNNRVLYYPAGSTIPTRLYGQPNYNSKLANNGGVSATSLDNPRGIALDKADNLYIADSYNNRVLFYPAGSTTATLVYGQPDFAGVLPNNGGIGPNSFYSPVGLVVDSTGGLYVCDAYNSRVLYFPNASPTGTLTILSSSAAPSLPTGQSLTLTATVRSAVPTASAPTQGQVEFLDGTNVVATVSVDSNGLVATNLGGLNTGQHFFTAHYKGSGGFSESVSPRLVQTVANSTITLTSAINPTLTTEPITLTATINSGGSSFTRTGLITFTQVSNANYDLGSAVSVTPTVGGATASFVVNGDYAGGHSYIATYGGDSNFSANVSPVFIQQINRTPSSVNFSQSSNSSDLGQTTTFTATVTPTTKFEGVQELTIKDGSTVLRTFSYATAPYTDTVVFSTSTLSVGQHNLTAQFSGAYSFEGATSTTLTHTITSLCSDPFVVTSPTDSGAGNCGTLSFALKQAVNATTPTMITLASPVITLNGAMPTITPTVGVSITIAGSCNTTGPRGVPGTQIVAGSGAGSTGITLTNSTIITGVRLTGFQDYAVNVTGDNNLISCSWIGTLDGNGATASSGVGVRLAGSNNRLGVVGQPASGNLISGNGGVGLLVESTAKNNRAYYTQIGFDANGTPGLLKNGGGSLKVMAGGQLMLAKNNFISS